VVATINVYRSSPTQVTIQMVYFSLATSPTAAAFGRSNYMGVAGYFGNVPSPTQTTSTEKYGGLFSNRTIWRFSDITDGSSNVFMFGETTGGKTTGTNRRQYGHTWMGSGGMVTAWGFSTKEWNAFSSEHPNAVHFCMADGSVKKVIPTITSDDFIFISGKHDAQQASYDAVQ
jgi:prepilin-type processing-associated H-X9-DG protein